ncbi:histidine phosphatase family protein [Paremcibacter congregatus]|uniref:histidine phosphatase family protein n=1 Tax=Paremcibacter congregatus TaxID=2043170 RepID=UPI0030ECA2C8|tara:strand:+ start:1706 stop:2377 length:672 start_codon:yes stop_codon:yes gene_type:complete
MGEIYLVRHGQASFNAENYDQLSPLGVQQARHLGAYFSERDINFDHLFTGTQTRHQQTADAILQDRALPPQTSLAGLNEYDFTALYQVYMAQHPEEAAISKDGDRALFYKRLKRALALWSEDRLTGDIPESWADFHGRVTGALIHIQESAPHSCLVVSSGGAIALALGHILGLDAGRVIDLNLQIKNASFSHIYTGRDALHLATFNNIPHLDRPDRLDAITYS